jgi:hypothetical protein
MSFLPMPADDELTLDARTAAHAHLAEHPGELTPLDRALLGDASVFEAYRAWFGIREQLEPYLGERAVDLYCHALTAALGAPYCVAHFRRVLEANGDDPDAPQVTDAERLLIEWATAIGADPSAIPGELTARVEATFQPRLRLLLTAFAGLTTAVAVFTLAGQIPGEA